MDQSSESPLIVVLGPTGSGKSDLAIAIAERFSGEIVGCDSLQLYRGFDIGTAKTPPADRRGIPHHMLDVLEPSEPSTAGDYARAGREILAQIAARGRLPVVAGGTGFYLRALLEGLSAGPVREPRLRERLEQREGKRAGSLHRILTRLDPVAAARIHANDVSKVMRALEVRLVEGRPMTALFAQGREPLKGFRPIKLGLEPPREQLYQALNARAEAMFARGLVAEVQTLLARGVSAEAKPFESLGYKQALQVLRGEASVDEAVQSTAQETRRYAKRQMTWFRREPGVHWLRGFGSDPAIQRAAVDYIAK